MSHHRETIEVQLSEVPPAKKETPVYGFGYRTPTYDSLASRVVDAALSIREMGDFDRNASPDIPSIEMLSLTPAELAHLAVDKVANRSTAVVVPLMDPNDYEIRTKTVKVSLNQKEWEDYRLGGWVVWKKIRGLAGSGNAL